MKKNGHKLKVKHLTFAEKEEKKAIESLNISDLKGIARERASDLGYDLGPFELNGDVWIATCKKSLCQALVFEDGRIDGTAVNFPCPENCHDKSLPFERTDMTPEFRSKLNKPWRPPSEG
jgi:hypothetical protein